MPQLDQAFLKPLSRVTTFIPESLIWRIIPKLPARLTEKSTGFSDLPDREFLRPIIFLYVTKKGGFHKILIIGCEWYTKLYKFLFKDKEYWRIEPDPGKKAFGAKNRYIIASLKHLNKYLTPNYFNVIIRNGVSFKGAIDIPDEAEHSFEQCFTHLRHDGILVLG